MPFLRRCRLEFGACLQSAGSVSVWARLGKYQDGFAVAASCQGESVTSSRPNCGFARNRVDFRRHGECREIDRQISHTHTHTRAHKQTLDKQFACVLSGGLGSDQTPFAPANLVHLL